MAYAPTHYSFTVKSKFRFSIDENGLRQCYINEKTPHLHTTTDHPWRVDMFYKHKQVAVVTTEADFKFVHEAVKAQSFELMTDQLTFKIYDRVSGCKIRTAHE